MHAGAGEVGCGQAAVRGREVAVGQAVQGDRRDGDGRLRGQQFLDLVVRLAAGCGPEAVPVGVQHHLDVVGIAEGHRGAFQRGVIEMPGQGFRAQITRAISRRFAVRPARPRSVRK